MKNKEKYYEEILEAFTYRQRCTFVQKYILGTAKCYDVSCENCRKEMEAWLEAEYVEPIRLTKNEKAILESIDKELKFIARDRCGDLFLYEDKPYKEETGWGCNDFCIEFGCFNHLFQFITFDDAEPYSIEELLKCEVVDDEC